MTPEKVIEVQKYGREPISLHTPLGEDGDSEFGDLIEDSEAIQPGGAIHDEKHGGTGRPDKPWQSPAFVQRAHQESARPSQSRCVSLVVR